MTYNVSLDDLQFPVYYIGTKKPIIDGNVYYFLTGNNTDSNHPEYRIHILDDKSVEGDTLAKRRLILSSKGVPLKKITKTIFFISDFIKIAKPNVWFMDAKGVLFKYAKTKKARLTFSKITKVINMSQGGAIIEVENVPGRHKVLFAPTSDKKYAGILIEGRSTILYGLYDKKYQDTYRMI